MREIQQANNNGYSNWLWNYGKQVVKGVTVLGVGALSYMGLKGHWNKAFNSASNSSNETGLVADTTTATKAIAEQNPDTVISTSIKQQNIWKTTEQTIQYRHKRNLMPLSDDFPVNTFVNNTQEKPAIASLNNGEFVITWTSSGQDGSGYSIYGQRYSNSGFPIVPVGGEFQVNNYTAGNQQDSVIAGLSDGRFVISWTSQGQDGSGYGIFAKIFAPDGNQLSGDFQVNNYTLFDQYGPDIARLSNDNFVITWFSSAQDGSDRGIYAQLFNANGTKLSSEFQVNNYTLNSQMNPAIASLNNGRFIIGWQSSGQDGSGYGIYAQQFFNNATKFGSEFQVNTDTAGDQASPAIVGLSNGDFVIAWNGSGQDDSSGIYAQRFSSNATRIGNQFLVNSYINNAQYLPAMTTLANGEFVIAWSGVGANGLGIYAQRFAPNTLPIGTQFRADSFTSSNDHENAAIANLGGNEFVIAWQGSGQTDSYGIYARWFDVTYSSSALLRNQLQIDQGQTITLSQNELSAVTENAPLANLVLTASNVTNGFFAKLTDPLSPIFNFTQLEINNGQIRFTQNDSYASPSYEIAVNDGYNLTSPMPVTVDFDRKPLWLNQQMAIANRRTVLLSPNELLAIDDHTNPQVFFEVKNINHGMFTVAGANSSIDNFTQQQVNASTIRFVHDGSNLAPSFEIRANDGRLYTAYQSSQINFTFNNPPLLTRNKANIVQGERHILNLEELAAADIDALTAQELGQLLFNFTAIKNGYFFLSTEPNSVIASAYQSQVSAGQLLFQHDGSVNSPAYNVTVE